MNQNDAIEVNEIRKSFETKIKQNNRTKRITNQVLDGISFTVKKGEVLGIIGINGSGKSTLLSIISKILEPDSGNIQYSGRVASILELGMGFHNDMTGRENIYLKGELYGFSKKDLDLKIEEIITYSGLESYIDYPVRTYSSGMRGRLAFAIMINVESDIMLVDEVLSVGDAYFEIKAKEHFKKLSQSGKTIIIVSHQTKTLETLCSRVIWIDKGKIRKDGTAREVCREYENTIYESVDVLKDLANVGDPEAQYKLALIYKEGTRIDKNFELYEKWVKKSMMQGNLRAQLEYADLLYERGECNDALELYNSAAQLGDYMAKVKVALITTKDNSNTKKLINLYKVLAVPGDGLNEYRFADLLYKTALTQNDYISAFSAFKKAADDGYLPAIFQVGLMYKDGLGTTRDIQSMEDYLVSAADLGYVPAVKQLIQIYEDGKILPRDDYKLFHYTLKASELGDAASKYKLAMLYRDGIGTKQDLALSKKNYSQFMESNLFWHKMSAIDYLRSEFAEYGDVGNVIKDLSESSNSPLALANYISYAKLNGKDYSHCIEKMIFLSDNNNNDATIRLANYYYEGTIVKQDYTKALELYERAAKQGDTYNRLRIAMMYYKGLGTTRNLYKALFWYFECAKQGNVWAMSSIVTMYQKKEIGAPQHLQRAIKMLKNTAKRGNIDAMKLLGDYYSQGYGVQKNIPESLSWYTKGANLGNQECIRRIRDLKGIV